MDTLRGLPRRDLFINVAVLVGFIVLCMGGGGVIGAITGDSFGDDSEWYRNLTKPCFNPPSAVFGPVWSILYLLMALAAFSVWTKTKFHQPIPLIAFFVQLGFNFLWPLVFGIAKDLKAAFGVIITLWLLIVVTIALFFMVKGRSWTHFLLLPYLAWVTFASALNYSLYDLNKDK